MKRVYHSAILFVFHFLALPLYAQMVVPLADSVDQHLFNFKEIEWLEDVNSELSIDEVSSIHWNSNFLPSKSFNPTNEHRQSTYWFRVKVAFPATTNRNWVIEFFDQTIDHLEFYSPDTDGKYRSTLVGDEMEFGKREI
ncbi:MAG: 7TM-DISM domain-containing protein, partial [Cyclobacteriaceae bacterium]